MKNLKTKILLLVSIILILMLNGICYAADDWCPGSSSGKHMWSAPSYSKKDAGNHNTTVTCMMCDEKSVLTQPHTLSSDTKYTYDDFNHWKTGMCTKCGTKTTTAKVAHYYKIEYSGMGDAGHKVTRKCKACPYSDDYGEEHKLPDSIEWKREIRNDIHYHYKEGECELCKATVVVSSPCTYENGYCKVCGQKNNVSLGFAFKSSSITYCNPHTSMLCQELLVNPSITGITWSTTNSQVVDVKGNMLKIGLDNLSEGEATLQATLDGETISCKITVRKNHSWVNKYDKDNHWSVCDYCGLQQTTEKEKHTFEEEYKNNDKVHWLEKVCQKCDYSYKVGTEESHQGIDSWNVGYDDNHHWKTGTCTTCLAEIKNFNKEKHTFENGKCKYCPATKVSTEDNTEKEAIIPTSIKFGRKETTICLECTPTAFSLVNGYTFTPTGVTEKGLVWTTNNSSVLNVSGTTITPEKIGKATLTAKSTAANSVSATCTVNIVAHKLKEEIKTDYDKNNHWTVGRCGYCGKNQKFNIQAHTFENGKCKYCPATKSSNTCVHEIDETTATIQYDANKHWQNGECVFCGKVFDDTDKFAAKSHTYGTVLEWESDTTYHWKEFSCTKCKYVKKEHKAKHTISAGSWEWKYNSRGESMHYKMGKCTKCKKTDLYAVRPTLCSYENGKCTVCNRKQSDETAVTEPVLQKISIVGGTNKTCVLGNIKLGDIKAEPAEAKIGNITWSSSNTSIIVIQNENYAMAVGTPGKSILTVKTETGITATYLVTVVNHEYDSNGKCKYCGNVKLTDKPLELTKPVEPAKEILPKEITFNRTSALLCLNHGNSKSKIECTMIAVPKILPENATNQDLTWSSSDSSILEIDGACVVAKQKGKVTLTAKTSNGLTATCNIEVVDHKKAQEMEYDYNGTNHWKYGICGNSLEDIYNTNEEKHTFVNGVCKCGKRVSIVSGEDILAGYEDVKRSDWYQESIEYVTEKKLMNGMGDEKFNPNGSMTRGMLVTVLYRMSRSTYAGKSEFIDVSEFEYYSTAVAWASENGIVKGIGDNSFAPDAEVTREQLITILYRYAKYTNRTVRIIKKSNISEFEDYIEISEYSLEAFEWGYVEKIISGRSTTTLNPKGTASRAEVATMLMRFEGEE